MHQDNTCNGYCIPSKGGRRGCLRCRSSPVLPSRGTDISQIGRFAVRAEQLGFSDLWTMDELVGRIGGYPLLEPLSLLAYVAARTTSIRLGVAVLVMPRHNPVALAKTTASIDTLASGRLTLGLGIGDPADALPGLGFSRRRPGDHLEEAVEVMTALWGHDQAMHAGERWQLDRVQMAPKPVQQPRIPIWLGVGSHSGLARAARIADGWIGAGASSSTDFSRQVQIVRRALDESGRDPGDFTIAKRAYVVVDDNGERARRAMRRWTSCLYADETIGDRVAITGDIPTCADQLAGLVAAGAERLVLNPVIDFEDQLDAIAEVKDVLAAGSC